MTIKVYANNSWKPETKREKTLRWGISRACGLWTPRTPLAIFQLCVCMALLQAHLVNETSSSISHLISLDFPTMTKGEGEREESATCGHSAFVQFWLMILISNIHFSDNSFMIRSCVIKHKEHKNFLTARPYDPLRIEMLHITAMNK